MPSGLRHLHNTETRERTRDYAGHQICQENPEAVKEKHQEEVPGREASLVDECVALDAELRNVQTQADDLRAKRNKISKEIGALMGQGREGQG